MKTHATARPMLFGFRRSAIIEIGLYLGGALLLDHFFFGDMRFRDVSPHPFWPIVLLTTVQYGTTEALLAAFGATLALLIGNVPPQEISQDTYDYTITLIREPAMWCVAAVVLGELRVRHVSERDKLQSDLAAALQREQDITNAYERLTLLKENLENRVAGQMNTAINMYKASRSLEQLDPSEVLLGVMEIVNAVMNPEKFSLYLLREDVLEISIAEGWTTSDNLSRTFRSDSRLFQEVIAKQRVVCTASPDDELVLGNEGLLAGPLVERDTGDVMGMLKVEKMGFFDLHFSNVQTFRVLCDWIADAYLNAKRFQAAQSESVIDAKTNLYSYSFLQRQLDFMRELAARVGFSLSILLLRVDTAGQLSEREQLQTAVALKTAVGNVLRKTDLAFDYRHTGYQYCILLPKTDEDIARSIGDRLLAELAVLTPGISFKYSVQTLSRERMAKSLQDETS